MMRPLYLDGSKRMHVALDGPALRVVKAGRANGQFPLRLVSRVVVRGQVSWSTTALTACMDEGIPVTFLSRDGSVRGVCLGPAGRDASVNRLLDEMLGRPDWREGHENWRRAAERRAILKVIRRFGLSAGTDLRPATTRERIVSLLPYVHAVAPQPLFCVCCGLVGAHVHRLLGDTGLEARFLARNGSVLALGTDFTDVLAWLTWAVVADLVIHFGEMPGEQRDTRRQRLVIVRHYEAFAPRIEEEFRLVWTIFDRWLREYVAL
jgi:hypothetical protein